MGFRRNTTYSSRGSYAARSAHAKGSKQFRKYDTSSIMPQRKSGPIVFGVVLVIIALVAIIFLTTTVMNACSPKNPNKVADGTAVTLVVADGSGGSTIAGQLYDAGLIDSTKDFSKRVEALNASQSLKPGTYVIVGGTSIDDIIKTLEAGAMGATVTVPEGYTMKAIASTVEQASGGTITADTFLSAASNVDQFRSSYSFLEGVSSLEGFLFPKTYELTSTTTAEDLIRAMLTQYQTETSVLDYSYPRSRGMSDYETLILASIVEKESDASNRAKVAAVLLNRLGNTDEPNYGYLQSDATTAYEVGHDPTADEVHADTPYSTYTHTGLPPTPICQPGLEALQAVCHPDGDLLNNGYYYFYFGSDGNGGLKYTFSQTLDQHNQAIAEDS